MRNTFFDTPKLCRETVIGVLSLSGVNSYLGMTTFSSGELDLIGANAWDSIMNLGGAYLSGGDLVFDYAGGADPYSTILGLVGTKITGSMPLSVVDDTINGQVSVLLVPEPSTLVLLASVPSPYSAWLGGGGSVWPSHCLAISTIFRYSQQSTRSRNGDFVSSKGAIRQSETIVAPVRVHGRTRGSSTERSN